MSLALYTLTAWWDGGVSFTSAAALHMIISGKMNRKLSTITTKYYQQEANIKWKKKYKGQRD